jgi:hypothetical protein
MCKQPLLKDVARAALLSAALSFFACTAGASSALASGACSNEQLREGQVYGLRLPDCRAYEQVSQVDKNSVDALGAPGFVQSSPSGEPTRVTFYSLAPFPSVPGISEVPGSGEFPTYLSTRDGDAWKTQGLLPPTDPGTDNSATVRGLTEDLAKAVISAREPTLAEGARPARDSYLRDSLTRTYQWLPGPGSPSFVDATSDDTHILIEATAEELVPGVVDETGEPFLYEWNLSKPFAEQLSFVGFVEGSAPQAGTAAGAGPDGEGGGAYPQQTISADGSRVFFTDKDNGHVYMREPEAGNTIPVSEGEAAWRAATPDGRYAFYTEGGELYRWSVDEGRPVREALTQSASGNAGVLGTLGVSDDGSRAYFTATGLLASGAVEGKANLYVWQQGHPLAFIAGLDPHETGDASDWRGSFEQSSGQAGEKSSRVTSAGTTMMFTSKERLTSYDNAGHTEVYTYVAGGSPMCVSCDPRGTPAVSDALLVSQTAGNPSSPPALGLTRNLSSDGSRVFFESEEPLVPQDTNGQMDVYEWEREGAGSCTRSSEGADGGCLYLISTGQSGAASYFGDASADGSDVFFFTRQSLVGQDQDNNADLYDARENGGVPAQSPPSLPPPCASDECLGAPSPPPLFGAPSSTTFSGTGNLAPPASNPPAGSKAKPLTRAQKRAKALDACRRKKSRKNRRSCEAQARKRYGKTARKAAVAVRNGGENHS